MAAQSCFSKEGLKGNELACSILAAYINACHETKVFTRRISKADELAALETEKGSEKVEAESIVEVLHNPRMQRRLSNQWNCFHWFFKEIQSR